MTVQYATTVLASGSSAPQIGSQVEQALYNLESSQPEGTQMQLTLDIAFPSWAPLGAAQVAEAVNATMAENHAPMWPGATEYATVSGANQVEIRWLKENVLIDLVLLILAGIAAGFIYSWIQHWSLSKNSPIPPLPSLSQVLNPIKTPVGIVLAGAVLAGLIVYAVKNEPVLRRESEAS